MANNNHLYTSKDARWDTIFGEIEFLSKVRRARDLYEQEHGGTYDVELFLAWMRDEYGVDIVQNDNGLTADYTIIDPQKHLLFELKFSS